MEGREPRAQPHLRVSKMKAKPQGKEEIAKGFRSQDVKNKGSCGARCLAVKQTCWHTIWAVSRSFLRGPGRRTHKVAI